MKLKRFIALVLALAFVFAFMAMSASAAVTRAACLNCDDGWCVPQEEILSSYTEYVGGCSNASAAHYHKHETVKITNYCPECGYNSSYTFKRVRCV